MKRVVRDILKNNEVSLERVVYEKVNVRYITRCWFSSGFMTYYDWIRSYSTDFVRVNWSNVNYTIWIMRVIHCKVVNSSSPYHCML